MGRFNAAMARPATEETPSPGPQIKVLPPPEQAIKPKPKLDFGGLKKKEAAQSTEYPVLPDPDGTLAAQACAFLVAQEKEEAAKGAKETARFELVSAARPFHFKVNSGHSTVPSSVSILSPKGEVRVTFKNAYKKLDETQFAAVNDVIGEELANTFLTQTFVFTIDSDKIPQNKMQDVIDGVTQLAVRLGITDAVAVATCYKPTSEWHTARFRHLTPEQNMRLEGVVDKEKGFCQMAVGPARGGRK